MFSAGFLLFIFKFLLFIFTFMETVSLCLIALCAFMIKILLGVCDYRKISLKSQVCWYVIVGSIFLSYLLAITYDENIANDLFYTMYILIFLYTMEKHRSNDSRFSMNGFMQYHWIKTFRK